MKHIFPWCLVATMIIVGSAFQHVSVTGNHDYPSKQQDPVITLRLTLPQVSAIVYSVRNSTLLDAKSANELADVIILQANDTAVNKLYVQPQRAKPSHP